MSGHSKWAQIKHKKAATDDKKGRLFSKMAREIMIAARAGGPEPNNNLRLRAACERARSSGLPKFNIERAIERASGGGDDSELREFRYEAAGPEGAIILIEGITDNNNRTFAEIRTLLGKFNSRIAEQGALIWNFEKRGVLEIDKKENSNMTGEKIGLAVIESGALDFAEGETEWRVETEFSQREKVREELEKRKIIIKEAGHDFIPRIPLEIIKTSREKIGFLLDALLDRDDVQDVYVNFK